MDVKGNVNIFVNAKECKDKSTFNTFTTKIGKEGKLYCNVRFCGDLKDKAQKLVAGKGYTINVEEGFLTNDPYNDKDYLSLVVLKASVVKELKQKDQERPF